MVLINAALVHLEDNVDEEGEHAHIIHRSLEKRIEDLEAEVKVLYDAISCLECKKEEDRV